MKALCRLPWVSWLVLCCATPVCYTNLDKDSGIKKIVTFDHRYFFNLLLPPIILNSGYGLQRINFFKHLGIILVFAILGTFLSTIIIGLFIYFLVVLGLHDLDMGLMDCMLFGAILSSTDPVTVLVISLI